MKCESLISVETIQAYRETEFRVFVECVVVLKIGTDTKANTPRINIKLPVATAGLEAFVDSLKSPKVPFNVKLK